MRNTLFFVLALLIIVACDDETTDGNCTGADCNTLDIRGLDTTPTDTGTFDTGGDTQGVDTQLPVCTEGELTCSGASLSLSCQNGQYVEQSCQNGEVCVEGQGCQVQGCTPGLPFGCETSGQETDQVRICNDDGITWRVQDCATGQKCYQGTCGDLICNPGEQNCKNALEIETCNPVGTGWEPAEPCGPTPEGKDTLCSENACRDLCSLNSKVASFLGCEYYVVDLDNTADSTDDQPFGITVSNPDPTRTANVRIVGGPCGGDADCPGAGVCSGGFCQVDDTVEPLGLKLIELNTDSDVDISGVHAGATFKVDSSIPVTVHQFNPLNGVGVFSNDASLLLPVNALGTGYRALMTPTAPEDPTDQLFANPIACNPNSTPSDCNTKPKTICGPNRYCVIECSSQEDCTKTSPSLFCTDAGTCAFGPASVYADVVATEDSTTVTITSPVPIPAGDTFAGIPADTPTAFTLARGELLHLLSPKDNTIDITGLEITADKPVAVFSGGVCSNIPDNTNFCDHVEQQLFPTSTWGLNYVAAKSFPRGSEFDLWRITAHTQGTTVTLDPPQQNRANGQTVTTATLDAGEVIELASTSDFEIAADQPILVGQFWVGSNHPDIDFHPDCGSAIDLISRGPCRDNTCQSVGGDRCAQGNSCVKDCNSDNECDALCNGDASCEANVFCNPDGVCAQGTGIGDPAFALSVSTEQYRSDYIVLTPTGYQENYMTLVVPSGKQILMDGARITDTPTDLNGTWDIYRLSVTEGAHELLLPAGVFGVTAYGYNCDVSYAYPGGLNLIQLN